MRLFLFFIFFLIYLPTSVCALTPEEELAQKIADYNQKIDQLRTTKDSLSKQLKLLDSEIALNGLRINQTEISIINLTNEISSLSQKIDDLDKYLNQLSHSYLKQVVENYKQPRQTPLFLLVQSDVFNNFFRQLKYLVQVQKANHSTLLHLESSLYLFDQEKQKKLAKQLELETLEKKLDNQKKALENDKKAKDKLLAETKNDETRYQALLSQARSELDAIEALIAGNGQETSAGEVKSGDKIASVIEGQSCNSSGTHLHFMVKINNLVQNPFSYLKHISHLDYSNGDSFNPSGSWNWPIKENVEFNQGYGNTWSVRNTWVKKIYSFHSGLDISSTTSNDVYATHDGTLYRGKFGASCTLKYVRIQDKSKTELNTLYLHVNYF
jgi:peptidoglycan hydrolase CwlO-like protein